MRDRENRFVPRRSLTVAFETPPHPTSYGLVANISEGGACVWTDTGVEVGQQLSLSLSVARSAHAISAEGRVVWLGAAGSAPGRRCGVKWCRTGGGPMDPGLLELIGASA
jgi:hypothetical protein